MGRYVFTHEWAAEGERLGVLAEIFDPATTSRLSEFGAGPGWRCLEIGAGIGSLAAWLVERVGPSGRVVATDVDTGFLERRAIPGVEVRRHDIVADDLEDGAFELVHARLVLEHLPGRDLALKRMASALAPGGLMLIEDFDWCSAFAPPAPGAELYDRAMVAAREFMGANGYDPFYGRRLAVELRNAGLTEVGAEGRVTVGLGDGPVAEWWRLTFERMVEPIVARSSLTAEEAERLVSLIGDPSFCFQYPALMTAWGRRPA